MTAQNSLEGICSVLSETTMSSLLSDLGPDLEAVPDAQRAT